VWVPALQFVTLVLAALSMTAESAHVLELPQKMSYDAVTYAAVNGTLYRYFAIVGGAYQVTSIVAAGLLAFATRGRRSFRWALAGAVWLLLALGAWAVVVAPVNGEVSAALRSDPARVPALWMLLRDRWEYGHALGFVLQLLGFGALVVSVLVDAASHRDGSMGRQGQLL
jgi:hypothetical protein